MSVITYPLNGINYDATDAETYLCTRTSGVYDSDTSFQLSIVGGRTVSIGTGLAWIKNEDFAGKSICSNSSTSLVFDLADSSLGRIDRVVLRFNKASNSSSIMILKGTPSANPVAPSVSRTADVYDLGLYTVSIEAGATSVSSTDVTDTRADISVCGRMGDGISGLNDLQQQINRINAVSSVTLTANGWSASRPYTQTVTVSGMTSSSEFWYGYNGTITTDAQADSWGAITSASSDTNTVTFSCYDEKPTVDIPVKVRGI